MSELLKRFQNNEITYQEYMRQSNLHYCQATEENTDGGYGRAIDDCREDEDKPGLYAGNGEYTTKVNYCCFCGYKSK